MTREPDIEATLRQNNVTPTLQAPWVFAEDNITSWRICRNKAHCQQQKT